MNTVNVLSKDIRKVIRKEVDFLPGAWVDFYDSVTVGQVKQAQKAKDNQDIDTSLDIVIAQIADWNFADAKGEILPINKESIELLPLKILVWLGKVQEEILADLEEDKKK